MPENHDNESVFDHAMELAAILQEAADEGGEATLSATDMERCAEDLVRAHALPRTPASPSPLRPFRENFEGVLNCLRRIEWMRQHANAPEERERGRHAADTARLTLRKIVEDSMLTPVAPTNARDRALMLVGAAEAFGDADEQVEALALLVAMEFHAARAEAITRHGDARRARLRA